ncbi:PhzF family phenazine biosynthesis protein [Saccharicrinis sp. GN24d3]|uniref:PhzF family phenazine biosynthesis protein n=1 Tax=Saccharicrinis sp. GN24d3 TaxID=3458416 RepID=UPI00403694B8
MHTQIYLVDAFADELFKGNPAAIVKLNKWLDEDLMQKIASENNLAETGFIAPVDNKLHIRWFTPTTEVDLCGHATLAAAHILFTHEDFEGDQVIFHSKSGILKVDNNFEYLTLDFPVDTIQQVNQLPELKKLDTEYLVEEVYRGKTDLMFVFKKEKHIAEYVPDFDLIRQLDCRGLIITAPGENTDFVSRFFGPQTGINEDPVTGSAHTTLTPYWAKRLKKDSLTAAQLSRRGGNLTCELKGDRVFIGGTCKTFLKGELFI